MSSPTDPSMVSAGAAKKAEMDALKRASANTSSSSGTDSSTVSDGLGYAPAAPLPPRTAGARPRSTSRSRSRNSSSKALRLLGVQDPGSAPGTPTPPMKQVMPPPVPPSPASGGNGSPAVPSGSKKAESKAMRMLGVSSTESNLLLQPLPLGSILDNPTDRDKSSSLTSDWFQKAREALPSTESLPEKQSIYAGEESEDDLVLITRDDNPKPEVKAGSLEKLILRLTYEKYPDNVYQGAFLLTYRSFTTPDKLLEGLVARYNIPKPVRMTDKIFAKEKQTPIRLRVVNVFKSWIKDYWYDFSSSQETVDRFKEFLEGELSKTNSASAKLLRDLLIKKQSNKEDTRQIVFSTDPPKSLMPSNLSQDLQLLDIHPEEVARQMTLLESELFSAIEPRECLNQAWNKSGREDNAPHILAMIRRFNEVSRWVATEIVKAESVQIRAVLLNRFIVIAEKCRGLNNYNAVMEILAGLQQSSVHRLKQTWGLLPSKTMELFTYLNSLMSREGNFKNFRESLHLENPPCIPYLGIYLTDLTFIETGNPDKIQGGLINFGKRRKIAAVIMEIQQYQQQPYNLNQVAYIQKYLKEPKLLNDSELHELSLKHEPREPKPSVPAPP